MLFFRFCVFSVCAMVLVTSGIVSAETEKGNIEEVRLKRLLVDDYEDGDLQNALGGACGTWNYDPRDEFTHCSASVVSMPAPELSKNALRLEYDINAPTKACNGYWMKLADVDVSVYDHVEFFVRGDAAYGFPSSFKLEIKRFKDEERTEHLVASYTVTNITSRWQRVSIPLAKFNAIADWTELDEFIIIFDDRLCDTKEGVMYFDSFRFVKTGHPGPSAFDPQVSQIAKTDEDLNLIEWAQWKAARLQGYPETVVVEKRFPKKDKEFLLEIAQDTWNFFEHIVDKETHLPLDTIILTEEGVFAEGSDVSDYTNVTNIGLYLTCLVAAYDFGFIEKEDVLSRIRATMTTLQSLESYNCFFYNYYDTTTTERTSNFISLIDSGWLASGMYIIRNAFPEESELVAICNAFLESWDFSFFYDDVSQQFYHGFYENIGVHANYHYGAFYTEPRMVSYVAIANGDIPEEHWVKLARTMPANFSWQQGTPVNRVEKSFRGYSYYGGYYEYKGRKYVPSWGGSLFEALMPTLLLKEKELSPNSLGANNKQHAEIHAEYVLEKLGYDVWGMSPSSVPGGRYGEFGVPFLGLKGYKDDVVTPHVTFLTLEYIPEKAIANLRTLVEKYKVYGEYGFYDAVNPETKEIAYKYLCLDQAMILISLDNYLNNGAIRKRFHADPVIQKAEYLLTEENLFE